jgi:hypothetical protein
MSRLSRPQLISIAVTVAALALTAVVCSSSARRFGRPPEREGTSGLPASTPKPVSPIRSVDFDNVAYPDFPDYSDPSGRKKKYVSLKPGDGGPNFINYGDVTGDEVEDAMVVLGIDNRESAIPYYVYIFTLDKGKPKIVWQFETGGPC